MSFRTLQLQNVFIIKLLSVNLRFRFDYFTTTLVKYTDSIFYTDND